MRHRTIAMAAAVVAACDLCGGTGHGRRHRRATAGVSAGDRRISDLGSVFSDRSTAASGWIDAVGLADGGKALVRFATDRPERASKIGTSPDWR